ncbi:hypothetical protein GCM10010954_21850 [Halobacillus andaensis]|uniref:Uncharacterized protein n=1 Tax=Halobacillus andaensis TaxID=1176239 RepID=A0A917B7C5_HALAA|nr:hypothetical protein GCM10010954_21850 [Halobacillus andaensis]
MMLSDNIFGRAIINKIKDIIKKPNTRFSKLYLLLRLIVANKQVTTIIENSSTFCTPSYGTGEFITPIKSIKKKVI